MMAEQGSENTQEQGTRSTLDDYANMCADLCEAVLAGEMNWDQVADCLFGPEPEITYTRWSA